MTHFRAAFPQHVEFVEEPCQADYLDAAEHYWDAADMLRGLYRRERCEVYLNHAEKFARVARRYNWQTGKRAFEPQRGKAGQE